MRDVLELLESAQERTGLSDFGPDSFREGLEILVRSLREEAHLSSLGETALQERIIGLLGQRLQIEDWYHRHPEIDDEPIVAPLIGVGLPRTGSTALSFLLAQDPNTRSLRTWENATPCPPPSTVVGPDPRIARAEAELAAQARLNPRHVELLPVSADGPQECQMLMGLDFRSQVFQAFAQVPSYSQWLVHADLTSTYEYERRALKLLQWGESRRPWRIKSPSHLLFLPYLDRAFPDARYVMTHRDPAEIAPSQIDLCVEIAKMFSEDIDVHYMAELNVEHLAYSMDRVIAFRDGGADDRFYDIDFRAAQRDPIGEVRGLYEWLGEPVTDEFEVGMAKWWHDFAENRPQNVHTELAAFGLDADSLRPRFAEYRERSAQWIARSSRHPV